MANVVLRKEKCIMTGFVPTLTIDYLQRALAPRAKNRKAASERKTYSVLELQERHRQIIRLKFEGLKNVEIAKQLMITPQNVSDVLNSLPAQEVLAEMHAAADKKTVLSAHEMMETAREAHELLKDVLKGNIEASTETRVKVATDYMARAGFAPIAKSQAQVVNGHFTSQELQDLKERAQAAKAEVHVAPENVITLRPS